jgi:hypothetical protein
MKLLFNNQNLVDYSKEKAVLQSAVNSGSNISLTVDDNNGFSLNDFVVVGQFLSPKTEIAKINASVTLGTSMQTDSLTFPHPANSPVTKITHDQVRLYSATTINGAKTLVETRDIDVDQEYTEFELADSSTGYRFFVLYNSATSTQGEYGPAINVGAQQSTRSYASLLSFVKLFYKDDIDQVLFEMLLQTAIDEIFAMRAWGFREASASFTTTEDVYNYNIVEEVGIEDFASLVSARTDDFVLNIIEGDDDDRLSLNQNAVTPYSIYQWGNSFHVRVPGAYTIYLRYLKMTESLLTAQSETGIKLASAVGYKILKLLFLTKDANMSDRFEAEYQKTIKILKKIDAPSLGFFSLPESGTHNKFVTPKIISD